MFSNPVAFPFFPDRVVVFTPGFLVESTGPAEGVAGVFLRGGVRAGIKASGCVSGKGNHFGLLGAGVACCGALTSGGAACSGALFWSWANAVSAKLRRIEQKKVIRIIRSEWVLTMGERKGECA